MTPPSDEFDVFLSHHSGDQPWAVYLKAALAERGVRVWLDRDEIRPGDLFIDALEQGIQRSRSLALIVSPSALKSAWVREEYQRAFVLANSSRPDLRIIPCLLRDATLPGFLASRHYVDFRDPAAFEQRVDELCWGIMGAKPTPVPASPATASAPVPASVAPAEIEFLDRSIANQRKRLRGLIVLRCAAPACGLASAVLTVSPAVALPALYVGSAAVTGLVGIGLTARAWSHQRAEVARLAAHRDALELCRKSPGPVCPEVIDAFHQYIKRSIGLAVPVQNRAPV